MSLMYIINIFFSISNTYLILFLSISTYIYNCIIARMHFRCHDVTKREFCWRNRRSFPISLTGPIMGLCLRQTAYMRSIGAQLLALLLIEAIYLLTAKLRMADRRPTFIFIVSQFLVIVSREVHADMNEACRRIPQSKHYDFPFLRFYL